MAEGDGEDARLDSLTDRAADAIRQFKDNVTTGKFEDSVK
jgi:hypothetical protein